MPEIVEPIIFLAPNEDGLIEVRFANNSAYLDEETAIELRDWLNDLHPVAEA